MFDTYFCLYLDTGRYIKNIFLQNVEQLYFITAFILSSTYPHGKLLTLPHND